MKKLSPTAAHAIEELQVYQLTVGLDLGDRSSYSRMLDKTRRALLEDKLIITPKSVQSVLERCRAAGLKTRDAFAVGRRVVEQGHA